jgi:hypothetical protein
MADIHGQLLARHRCTWEPGRDDSAVLDGDDPWPVEPKRLFFRATDLGVRWIVDVKAQHLLWL